MCAFRRETLVQVVSGTGLLVCYKAKDLLRTALQHYRPQISWKQGKAPPNRAAPTYHNHLTIHYWETKLVLMWQSLMYQPDDSDFR